MKKNKRFVFGRSITEMLAVLAIIGILSIVALIGYNHAMNKERANKIIHDGRIVHTDTLSLLERKKDWTTSSIVAESGKAFLYMLDIAEHPYVKVEKVEKDICNALLTFSDFNVHFYTTENVAFTECEKFNDMIIDYDNNGPMAECSTYSDCEGWDVYCANGQCETCSEELGVNSSKTGCNCPSDELTCSDGKNNTWCCGKDADDKATICGTIKDECISSEGYCSYAVTTPVQKRTIASNCSYTVTTPVQKRTLASNCSYTVTAPVQKRTIASNCSYTITQSGSSVSLTENEGSSCPDNQYCRLLYTKEDCSASVTTSGYTGIMYGVCVAQNSTNTQCLETSSETTGGLSEIVGCPDNQYCRLLYSKEDCSASVTTSGYTGTMYGVCVAQNSTNTQCLETSSETTGGLSEIVGCPANQYCYLKYSQNKNCSSSVSNSGYTGTMYGVCISQASNNAVCPVK